MEMKHRFKTALFFFLAGIIYYGMFLYIFIKMFQGRWPFWQEYSLFLTGLIIVTIFVFFRDERPSG